MLNELIGKKIQRIFLTEDYLQFLTDQGTFCFSAEGDCCSHSVFYDFIGVKKLLENGPVKSVRELSLEIDNATDRKQYDESIQAYGYEIVTEHPIFGEMTSVFSFRNYSNGYYGGFLVFVNDRDMSSFEIFDDVLCTEDKKRDGRR